MTTRQFKCAIVALVCISLGLVASLPAAGADEAFLKKQAALIKKLQTSKGVGARADAARDLGNLRAIGAVSPLAAALSDPDPAVRAAAAYSLGQFKEDAMEAKAVIRAAVDTEPFGAALLSEVSLLEFLGVSKEELMPLVLKRQLTDRDLATRVRGAQIAVGDPDPVDDPSGHGTHELRRGTGDAAEEERIGQMALGSADPVQLATIAIEATKVGHARLAVDEDDRWGTHMTDRGEALLSDLYATNDPRLIPLVIETAKHRDDEKVARGAADYLEHLLVSNAREGVGRSIPKKVLEEVIQVLKELGYQPLMDVDLLSAALRGHVDVVDLCLAAGVPVDAPTGKTALSIAIQSHHFDVAARLLGAGANANAPSDPDPERDERPLTLAVLECDQDEAEAFGIVKLLLKAGAEVDAADTNGSTALLWAADHCSGTDIIKALIGAGANVNARAAGGATPLMMARIHDRIGTQGLLRQAGAHE